MAREDLVGRVFDRWTVKQYGKNSYYICECICGSIKSVAGSSLKSGSSKSCGCLKKEIFSSKPNWMGSNRLPSGEASMNAMIDAYKRGARERNLEYSLTKEQFRELTSLNCWYCNKPPSSLWKQKRTNGSYLNNGIDRKNNNIGYTIENSVPCCTDCNFMKSSRSYEDFLNKIKEIYECRIMR